MKKINLFLLLIFSLLIFSCSKKDEKQYKDIYGEIIYTDSFSPEEWENPASRIKIETKDKDIGKFIKEDVMDPNLKEIFNLLTNFIDNMVNKNNPEIEKILTPGAYNSYNLRIPNINFDKKYSLRVAYPAKPEQSIENQDDPNSAGENIINRKIKNDMNIIPEDLGNDPIWIEFKLLFPTKSIIGKIEMQKINKKWTITDFDTKFFEDIESAFKKKKS